MYLKALRASLGAKAAREAKGCFHVALGLFNFPTERAGEVAASRGAGSSAVTARRKGEAAGREDRKDEGWKKRVDRWTKTGCRDRALDSDKGTR